MDWIVRESFSNCEKVTDRFHVQKLVSEALQEMRVKERWKAIDEENEMIQKCRKLKLKYITKTLTTYKCQQYTCSNSRAYYSGNIWSHGVH